MSNALPIVLLFLVACIAYSFLKKERSEKPEKPPEITPGLPQTNPYLEQIETAREFNDTLKQRVDQLEEKSRDLELILQRKETELATETERNRKLNSAKISQSVKVGLVVENLAPLLSDFPYCSKKVRGLYNPIDFIVFDDEEIVFVEVKSQNSKLSQKQKKIKDMINAGKVRFEEFKVKDTGIEIIK